MAACAAHKRHQRCSRYCCLMSANDRVTHCVASRPVWHERSSSGCEVSFLDVDVVISAVLNTPCLDEDTSDPEVTARINIGFPQLKPSRSAQLRARLDHLKAQRTNKELEQLARSQKCECIYLSCIVNI